MEDTPKRRGRPVKSTPEEVQDKDPSVSWDELVAMVHSMNAWDRRITCIVHPDAMGTIESPKFGGIRAERGPAGYVVSVARKPKDEHGNELPFVHHKTERVTL